MRDKETTIQMCGSKTQWGEHWAYLDWSGWGQERVQSSLMRGLAGALYIPLRERGRGKRGCYPGSWMNVDESQGQWPISEPDGLERCHLLLRGYPMLWPTGGVREPTRSFRDVPSFGQEVSNSWNVPEVGKQVPNMGQIWVAGDWVSPTTSRRWKWWRHGSMMKSFIWFHLAWSSI